MMVIYFRFLCVWMILSAFGGHGQTVQVPDSNFRNCLKSRYASALNANGEIVPSAAAKLTGRLACFSAQIRSVEGIQYFTGITDIQIYSNSISFLPDLSPIANLIRLDVSRNQLNTLPSLDKLTQLTTVNASNNSLTSVPKLPAKIDTLFLDNNQLNTLLDFSTYTSLKTVRLFNNRLSFKELLKLVPISNYKSLFQIAPQLPFLAGKKLTKKEGDTAVFRTGIDNGITGVTHDWYLKEIRITTIFNKDSLVLPNIDWQDSGTYNCHVRHASFPNFTLTTTPYYLSILPCIDTNNTLINTTEINCLHDGTVTVEGNFKTTNTIQYLLTARDTKKTYTSTIGYFKDLPEPSYLLTLKTTDNCVKKYPHEIRINTENCEEVVISPNGDGDKDTYFFTDNGSVTIYDKKGNFIKNMSIPGEWDGKSSKGKLATGFYVADINNGKEVINITVLF